MCTAETAATMAARPSRRASAARASYPTTHSSIAPKCESTNGCASREPAFAASSSMATSSVNTRNGRRRRTAAVRIVTAVPIAIRARSNSGRANTTWPTSTGTSTFQTSASNTSSRDATGTRTSRWSPSTIAEPTRTASRGRGSAVRWRRREEWRGCGRPGCRRGLFVILKSVAPELRLSVRPARVQAIMQFGFTERQARFLVHVLVFSGVFLERQYRAFTGLAHGQKTHDFLAGLVDRGYATAITPGALHRGRFYHLQYKPLYEAIGEPNNRHRRPASLGRVVERLMLLDAVLADGQYDWLGTERDKRAYFTAACEYPLPEEWYPHLTFRAGNQQTMRFFSDNLPIGRPRRGERRDLFLYLATPAVPMDFRVFLLRHAELLAAVEEWTVRVL